jgi:hypothetical protein
MYDKYVFIFQRFGFVELVAEYMKPLLLPNLWLQLWVFCLTFSFATELFSNFMLVSIGIPTAGIMVSRIIACQFVFFQTV